MIMRLVIMILLLLTSFPSVYGDHRIFPVDNLITYITLEVIDDKTDQFVGSPVIIEVLASYENQLLYEYNITLLSPIQNISMPWNPNNQFIGTVFSLTAIKDGYLKSEPYVFTVNPDTPIEGLLFQHTFRLSKIGDSISSNKFIESIIIDDKSFDFEIVTSSILHDFVFDNDKEILILSIDEPRSNGFLNISIPTSFMKSPFTIFIGDIAKSNLEVYTQSDNYILVIQYGIGTHTIKITGEDVFRPTTSLPVISIDASDSTFNENEQVVIKGTIDPIQPSSDVVIELINPSDEIIIRIVQLLGDGTFEFIFNPDETGEWKAIAKYNFNEEIIESNIIGFSVISISEPRVPPEVPEPEEPEPKPEEPGPELIEPVSDERKEPESKPVEEKPEEKSEISLTSYIVSALVLLMIIGGGIYFYMNRKDSNTKRSPQEPKVEDGEPVLEPTPGSIEEPNKDNGTKKLFNFKPKIKEHFRNLNYKIFIGFLLILLMLPLGYGYYQVQDDLSQIEIECNGFSDFDLKVKTVSAVMHNTVKNPTEREISIDLIQYQVFSNNTQVANGTITKLVIPANTTTTLKSDIEIESSFLLNLFLEELIGAFDLPELTAELTLHQSGPDKNIHAMPLLDSKSGEIKNANLVYIEFSSGIFFEDIRIINYSYPDSIDGKIALIERDPGETNFFWKYSSLTNEGVKGVIIYNNEPGLFDAQIANFGRWNLTMVIISQKDGQMLLENIENNEVSLNVREEQNQKDELPLIIKGTITKKFGFIDLKTPFEIPNQCNFNPN